MTNHGRVAIYACGGAAISACSIFETSRGLKETGIAEVDVVYLDKSDANFKKRNIPEDKRFIIPGGEDGSGGERSINSKVISTHILSILQKFEPGYVNIVISSGSGGSGSVIAPLLVKTLLAQENAMVIPIVIGDARYGHWIKNTLGTLATYENISESMKKSIAIGYFENTEDHPPSAVDDELRDLIAAISVLFSQQNEGLDTRDLYNFLNFDRMTSYDAHCGQLKVVLGTINEESAEGVMTAVSVITDKDDTGIKALIGYAKQGELPEDAPEEIAERAPMHLVTHAYPFNGIAQRLRENLAMLDKQAAARTVRSTVLQGVKTDGGDDLLVF